MIWQNNTEMKFRRINQRRYFTGDDEYEMSVYFTLITVPFNKNELNSMIFIIQV